MRKYYVLSYDAREDDTEVVSDFVMGEFDLRVFWRGERFRGSIPPEVRLWVAKGDHA